MAYSYYRPIVIDHTKCGSVDSSNWTFLFSSTVPSLKTVANGGRLQNASGFDHAWFTSNTPSGPLKFETKKWIGTTGQLIEWVKVPTLSASSDTTIYLVYGDATITTSQADGPNTWDASSKLVCHGGDGTTLDVTDSTANANNGAQTNCTAIAGKINGAINTAAAGFVNFGTSASLAISAAGSLSLWIKLNSKPAGATIAEWITRGFVTTEPYFLDDNGSADGNLRFGSYDGNSIQAVTYADSNLSTGTWYHVYGTNTGTAQALYINGVSVGTGAFTFAADNTQKTIASDLAVNGTPQGRTIDGVIEEIKIANASRALSWILSEYNNQNNPGTFYTVNVEQNIGGGGGSTLPLIGDGLLGDCLLDGVLTS